MKLALIAIIILALLGSLVTGLQFVEVIEANFIPYGTVTIISPANQTYTSNFLILTFTATFSVTNTKTITYSIDGQPQVTIPGLHYSGDVLWETTNGAISLPYLPNGSHHLEMYAKTNSTTILPNTGYGSVHFTISSTTDSQTPTITPTPSSQTSPTITPTTTPTTPNPSETTNPIPKPSIPTFIVTNGENSTIKLSIKNQPFDVINNYHYSLVYDVRIKTENGNWTSLYNAEDGYPIQSNSSYTILQYVQGEIAYYPSSDYPLSPSTFVGTIPTRGQVDFQVRAMIGYRDRGAYSDGIMPYVFKGEYSDWSSTQTLTIPSTSHTSSNLPTAIPLPTSSLSPSDSPTQPTSTQTVDPFPISLVIAVVIVVVIATIVLVVLILAGLLVYIRKYKVEANNASFL